MNVKDLSLKNDFIIKYICENSSDFSWKILKKAREIFKERHLDSEASQEEFKAYEKMVEEGHSMIEQGSTKSDVQTYLRSQHMSEMEVDDFIDIIFPNLTEVEGRTTNKGLIWGLIAAAVILFRFIMFLMDLKGS